MRFRVAPIQTRRAATPKTINSRRPVQPASPRDGADERRGMKSSTVVGTNRAVTARPPHLCIPRGADTPTKRRRHGRLHLVIITMNNRSARCACTNLLSERVRQATRLENCLTRAEDYRLKFYALDISIHGCIPVRNRCGDLGMKADQIDRHTDFRTYEISAVIAHESGGVSVVMSTTFEPDGTSTLICQSPITSLIGDNSC
ncbi:hypothetical protein EVAR_51046_1 [Eumeta japonica]|uniref:Uncharacterized protein n=1 Tax=Eumeta variegata TaxID=151549 RepID=A0A4C1Y879_EUMVA|nr:hypothetical protein EVAR_51046_1 [Eumeta japonica]